MRKCYDHLGNEFKSNSDMCKAYGVNKSTFNRRIKDGKTLEQALTDREKLRKQCTDHLGNTYNSKLDMCIAYGIKINTFDYRIKDGKTLEQALTDREKLRKQCTDHVGNTYNSLSDMCDTYRIELVTFISRIKDGKTLEQALTAKISKGRCIECTDHLGNKYKSKLDMYNHYGIDEGTFRSRISSGIPLCDALTLPLLASKITMS